MERYAITGYVADRVVDQLDSKHNEQVEVSPALGEPDVLMRIKRGDIAEVRKGSSTKGQTLVELILRDGAPVETVLRSTADVKGVARFNDPAISRLTASATAKVIAA